MAFTGESKLGEGDVSQHTPVYKLFSSYNGEAGSKLWDVW